MADAVLSPQKVTQSDMQCMILFLSIFFPCANAVDIFQYNVKLGKH